MKITYRKLIDSIPSFKELNEIEFMPRTALDLAKLSKVIDSELITFDETRTKLAKRYENTPEDEEKARKQSEKATKEFTELLDSEVDIEVKTIPFTIIERTNRNIKPSIFIALDWLLESPAEEVPEVPQTTPMVAGK